MDSGIQDRIVERISAMPVGEVFTISDFSDICGAKTASKTIDRLLYDGLAEKVMRGIFWRPDGSKPNPSKIADALARSNKWHIAPCGETALHLFGIREMPREWTFVTDGTYREYDVGDVRISFKHTSGRLLAEMSKKTLLVIQVLKAFGQERIPEKVREKFSSFTKAEKELIISETRGITAWISSAIKNMLSK